MHTFGTSNESGLSSVSADLSMPYSTNLNRVPRLGPPTRMTALVTGVLLPRPPLVGSCNEAIAVCRRRCRMML